jgi:multicomponent Na+:H+ antiporter subunit D
VSVPLSLPVLIPLVAAAVSLVAWRHLRLQRLLGVLGAAGLLLAAIVLIGLVRREGIQTAQMAGWPAPFGITLVADHFSAIMLLVTGVIGLAVTVYSVVDIDVPRQSFAYFPLLQILLMGVSAAFLAGDLFNLYVWFEVMLISSFVLLALGSERAQLEGALKYVTLNLISSFLFLTAVGILYGAVGTLNMADIAQRLESMHSGSVTTLAMLFLIAFGIKAALFPLFFWLPASYHTPPAAVSAVFAGLLTKVGVYALIRVFTLLFVHDVGFTHTLILIVSGLTMVSGVLGAIAQNEFRRILSFHIVSQIGYMTLGLGLFTPLGLAASIFYIVHHIIVKTNLFLVSGIAHMLRGTYELDELGGLYRRAPWLALGFAVPALSLAGIPPLSGFIAKLGLIRAGFETGEFAVVGVAIAVSLLTLFSMAKIWNTVFWKEPQPPAHPHPVAGEHAIEPLKRREIVLLAVPVVLLAAITVSLGLLAGPAFSVAQAAADELLDPARYIETVLGDRQ